MKLIDISHVLNEQPPIYPGDTPLRLTKEKTLAQHHYNGYFLQTGLHVGTHIDAPMHLLEDSRSINDFDINLFAGRGVLLDVRGQKIISMQASYSHCLQQGDIPLLYTGWDKHYHKEKYFQEHPVVSEELGAFLLSKKIKMLGMDMPSPDHAPFLFHKQLLEQGCFVLENITNLQALVGVCSFEVMAFPLKISAEASLVRAVCSIC